MHDCLENYKNKQSKVVLSEKNIPVNVIHHAVKFKHCQILVLGINLQKNQKFQTQMIRRGFKKRIRKTYHQKVKEMKKKSEVKYSIYGDLIKDIISKLVKEIRQTPQTQGAHMGQIKDKLAEISLFVTEECFKNAGNHCGKDKKAEEVISQLHLLYQMRNQKKLEIISLVNYVRRITKALKLIKKVNSNETIPI